MPGAIPKKPSSVQLTPIVLPPMTSRANIETWKGPRPLTFTVLQEQLSVVYALIQARKIERAEKIFNSLRASNRDDMRQLCDTNVYNVFIDAYMDSISPDATTEVNNKALKEGIIWFQRLKRADLTPDTTSYASVIRGLLKTRNDDEVHLYLTELLERSCPSLDAQSATGHVVLESGSVLDGVLHHPYLRQGLAPPLLSKFCKMLTERRIPIPDVYTSVLRDQSLVDNQDDVALDVIREEIDKFNEMKQQALQAASEDKKMYALEADLEGLPEALPVKSLGLQHLKQHLSVITKHPHLLQANNNNNKFALYTLQLKLEEEAYSVALDRLKEEVTAMAKASSSKSGKDATGLILGSRNASLKKYMWQWYQDLRKSIEDELELVEMGSKTNDRQTYGPFLQLLPASKLAMITILELLRLHNPVASLNTAGASANPVQVDMFSDNVKVNKAVVTIGAAVEAEINAQAMRKKQTAINRQRAQEYAANNSAKAAAPLEPSALTEEGMIAAFSDAKAAAAATARPGLDSVDIPAAAATAAAPADALSATEMDMWLKSYLNERLYTSQRLFNMTIRKLYQKLQSEQTPYKDDDDFSDVDSMKEESNTLPSASWIQMWPQSMRAKVGSVLLSLILDIAKVEQSTTHPETGAKTTELQSAFYHTYTYQRGKRLGVIKFHPQISELLSRDPLRVTLHPKLLPMLVRPRPWLTFMSGGYLTSRSACMRFKDRNPEQVAYLRAAAKNNRLDYILASLDVLGSTPWQINKDIFRVVLEAWNTGEEIADIPQAVDELIEQQMMPTKPADYETNTQARREYQRKAIEVQNKVRNSYSLRCDANYKLEIARTFLGSEIYFPHNIDFRGRAYPIPVHLNHISSDLCRGLLVFSEAKPLRERGWHWLRVHLANLYGYDKQSFTDRVRWVDENMDSIMDSVDRPLDGKRWWLKADDPWQCLATCFEIAKAVRSGDPLSYASRLPVHQDGTCNGLQHYAALGGDIVGAKQVNLIVGDKPSDVYMAVADLVAREVEADAAKGNKHGLLLKGMITRKIVKQTVMTNVYGVTFIGARLQIQNRLKETKSFDEHLVWELSTYLARKVFNSLGEIFSGAQAIQNWLNEVARRIAKSVPASQISPYDIDDPTGILNAPRAPKSPASMSSPPSPQQSPAPEASATAKGKPSLSTMTSVIWTTPLGLTCVQPYRRDHKTQVKTLLQTIHLTDPNHPAPVNVMKQRSAFPPNFIHSLDASHMMMTAISCHHRGLTFASVHDSYWTHPADVDDMNGIIREEFINLHRQPIMDNLVKEFATRYANYVMPADVIKEYKQKLAKGSKKITIKNKRKSPVGVVVDLVSSEDDTLLDTPAGDKVFDDDADDDAEDTDAGTHSSRPGAKWVPLELPPLPARGEFDVQQVKESPYFFH
ncbi:DNA-directed RNA polymerase [Sorochytrium milnesiophthora]